MTTFAITGKRESLGFTLQPHTQLYDVNSVQEVISCKTADEHTLVQLRDAEVPLHADGINQHLDRRLALFFQQSILCFNVPFEFSSISAQDQYGKGSSTTFEVENKKHIYKTEAAHSSTLPCLIATPLKDGVPQQNQDFVYLRHSHAYTQHNATMELPRPVNRADCLLDGKMGENKLRDKALAIINQVAQAKLEPKKATRLFLNDLIELCEATINSLPEDDKRREVFSIYLEHANDLAIRFVDSDLSFDDLMGVKLNWSKKSKKLREIVYARRYKLIQTAETIHSQISRTILNAQNEILNKKNKSLKKIDYRLRFALLKSADGEEKIILEKLFCTSIDQLLSTFKTDVLRKDFEKRIVDPFITKHTSAIQTLKRDIRALCRTLEQDELTYRSSLFKDLRTRFKNWTQEDFARRLSKKFPLLSISRSTVSRLEQMGRPSLKVAYLTPESQRCKTMTIQMAHGVATTFGVDPGVLLPSLFASS